MTLLAIADQLPRTAEELQAIPGFTGHMLMNYGIAILQLLNEMAPVSGG